MFLPKGKLHYGGPRWFLLIQVEREHEEADGNSEVEDGPNSVEQPSRMRTRYLVVLCILFVELCERLTFYGVAANLVFYCKDILKLTSPLPSTITLAFQGIIIMCFSETF